MPEIRFLAYNVCINDELTQLSVVEGEVSQICRVLRQGEKTSGQTVPHESTP